MQAPCIHGNAPAYRRRAPEQEPLYQVMAEHPGRFMATLAHTDEDIRITAEAARESLQIIRGGLEGGLDELLEGAEKRDAIQRIVR